MKCRHLRMGIGFLPLFEAHGVQAAQMVIPPGGREGDPTTVIGARTSGCSWHPAAAWPSWKARGARCGPAACC